MNVNVPSGVEEVATAAAMDALLVEANVGKYYKFTGTTDSNYTNGDLYLVEGGAVSSGETWVLNESGLEDHLLSYQSVAFTSNGKSYIAIQNFSSGSGLFYYTTEYNYDVTYVDGGPDGFFWENQAYRTITFSTPPTGDLLTWLQANGTKQ